jgi:hypothetical protein
MTEATVDDSPAVRRESHVYYHSSKSSDTPSKAKPKETFGSKAGGALGKGIGKPFDLLLHTETIVTAGFVTCALVTLAEAFTGTDDHADDSDENWGHHLLVREIAVCVVFLVLALVSTVGKSGGKIASGLTILVTIATLFNSDKLVSFAADKLKATEKSVT